MGKFKGAQTGEIYRTLDGNLRVLEKKSEFIYKVEMMLLSEGVNRNNWEYLNLEEHRTKFAGIPILTAYINKNGRLIVGDGHNFQEKRDKNGKAYPSYVSADAQRIVGAIPDDETQVRIEYRDGKKWIVATGYLWAWYAHELVEKIASQGRGLKVSIETYILTMHMDGDTEVYDSYEILGVTILGDGVREAVAGANIRSLSEMDGFKELKLRAASYIGNEQINHKPNEKPNKGECNMSKRLIAQMADKFPNHRIVSASDDGMYVVLSDKKDGAISTYAFNAEDNGEVVEARIKLANLKAVCQFAENASVTVDVAELTDEICAQLMTANASIAEKDKELATANATIETMRTKENARRVKACKSAVKAKFAEINAAVKNLSGDELDVAKCAEVEKAIDNGEYAKCENAEGEWNGDERACADLEAKCMSTFVQLGKKAAEEKERMNNAKNRIVSWDLVKENAGLSNDDGIEGLIARNTKRK